MDPESEPITYQIHLGSGFSIDQTGLLIVSSAFDYETLTQTQTQAAIKASAGGHVIYQNLTINIQNDASDDVRVANVTSNNTYFTFSLSSSNSMTMIFYFIADGNRDNWDRVFNVRNTVGSNNLVPISISF